MTRLAIVGFGELGRQILGLLPADDRRALAVFDDVLHDRQEDDARPLAALLDPEFADHQFFVALGYHHLPLKQEILRRLQAAGRRTPSLVHPAAHVHPAAVLGDGCVIHPLCSVGQHARVGTGALLHQNVTVAHDATIGDASYLSPGVVLSGGASVGDCTFVGAGAIVANGRRIGNGARIGIGTVVTRDIEDGASAIGNPMRVLGRRLRLD